MNRPPTLGEVIRVVFHKELRDGLRDWRSIISALIYPVLAPAMIVLIFYFIADTTSEPDHLVIPVNGAENAPELIDWLRKFEIDMIPGPADPKAAVRDGEHYLVLVIPEDYGEKFAESQAVTLRLYLDSSRNRGRAAVAKVTRLLQQYGQQYSSLRLIAHGLNPEVAAPLVVKEMDVADDQRRAVVLLHLIPMFVLLGAFVCGMQIAMDVTAGERERGSLEPLLLNPAPRRAIALGKWLATVVFSGVGMTITLSGSMLVIRHLPLENLGLRIDFGLAQMIGVFAAVLPLSLLASGMQMLVATYARSFKEAQTYLTLLIFLPLIPAYWGMMFPFSGKPWMIPVPLLGQEVLLTQVIGGESPDLFSYALAGLTSLGLGMVCLWWTALLFRREEIIFGR